MRGTLIVLALAASFSNAQGGTHPDGVSKVSREQDALGNYKFSYAVSNAEGEHFREEGTDEQGRVVGTYGLTHKDGRQRVVDYVADKNGFRAEVRSNEPGLASSENGDATILKLRPDLPLSVAATDIDSSQSAFGSRLNSDNPRVAYVGEDDETKPKRRLQANNAPRESRQRNIGDYRPRNPVAYYPEGSADSARPSNPSAFNPEETQRRPRNRNLEPSDGGSSADQAREQLRSQDPAVESRPPDSYIPPLNPFSAVRRPYIDPSGRLSDRPQSTSRRPFVPPYGGFENDRFPIGEDPRPGRESLDSFRGGLRDDDYQTATPSYGSSYGSGRYPSENLPLSRDFIRSEFPPALSPPRIQRPLTPPVTRSIPPGGSVFPSGVGRGPPGFFGPPSFGSGRPTPEKFVLRAVPIPNGIQAVRVDPETGRVLERVLYPLYLTRDGRPEYDRNALLNYDVNDDEGGYRDDDGPGFDDFPFRGRSPFRSARTADLDNIDHQFRNRSRLFNGSFVDPRTLSMPTARDLSWIQRQLALVEDFDQSRFSDPPILRNRDSDSGGEYPIFNDFDDSSDESIDREDSPYVRDRNLNLNRRDFSRNPRNYDRLQPEDTKAILVSEPKSVESDPKAAETDPNPAS